MEQVFRKEIKYRISKVEFSKIQPILEKVMQRDPHGGDRGYWVRSVYLDSVYDKDLRDVLDGNFQKSKIRLRVYARDSETVKLEHKSKKGSDQIKSTLTLTTRQAEQILQGNFGFLLSFPDEAALDIYLRLAMNAYRPKIMVEYRRLAYLYEANSSRVTFDTQVRVDHGNFNLTSPESSAPYLYPPDTGILEVKYDYFLCSFIREALKQADILPMANSKYASGRLYM